MRMCSLVTKLTREQQSVSQSFACLYYLDKYKEVCLCSLDVIFKVLNRTWSLNVKVIEGCSLATDKLLIKF